MHLAQGIAAGWVDARHGDARTDAESVPQGRRRRRCGDDRGLPEPSGSPGEQATERQLLSSGGGRRGRRPSELALGGTLGDSSQPRDRQPRAHRLRSEHASVAPGGGCGITRVGPGRSAGTVPQRARRRVTEPRGAGLVGHPAAEREGRYAACLFCRPPDRSPTAARAAGGGSPPGAMPSAPISRASPAATHAGRRRGDPSHVPRSPLRRPSGRRGDPGDRRFLQTKPRGWSPSAAFVGERGLERRHPTPQEIGPAGATCP